MGAEEQTPGFKRWPQFRQNSMRHIPEFGIATKIMGRKMINANLLGVSSYCAPDNVGRYSRTHLGLAKDAPIPRPVQPPSLGRVIALPQVGGLHHRYERRAA
jgi:hypothetical protein